MHCIFWINNFTTMCNTYIQWMTDWDTNNNNRVENMTPRPVFYLFIYVLYGKIDKSVWKNYFSTTCLVNMALLLLLKCSYCDDALIPIIQLYLLWMVYWMSWSKIVYCRYSTVSLLKLISLFCCSFLCG